MVFSNIYTVTIFGQSSTGDESTGRVYTAVHTKITVVVYDTFPTFTNTVPRSKFGSILAGQIKISAGMAAPAARPLPSEVQIRYASSPVQKPFLKLPLRSKFF